MFVNSTTLTWGHQTYTPSDTGIRLWHHFLLWQLFHTVPFLLSQQISVCLMTFGQSLKCCTYTLNQAILEESQAIADTTAAAAAEETSDVAVSYAEIIEISDHVASADHFDVRYQEMERLLRLHAEIVRTCRHMNATFGATFAASFILDMICMLGFLNNLVSGLGRPMASSSLVFNIVSFALYATYSNIFLVPQIGMHEQVSGSKEQQIA